MSTLEQNNYNPYPIQKICDNCRNSKYTSTVDSRIICKIVTDKNNEVNHDATCDKYKE